MSRIRCTVEHPLGGCHRCDASACLAEYLPCFIAPGFPGGGEQQRLQDLHVVLGAMIEFVEQQTLLRLSLPSLADVHQHIDRADDLPRPIAQRCWKWNERNARAVRPFSDRFSITYRSPFPQGDR